MAFEGELLALLPRLRRFAAGLSRNAADGDDLCQAALERALKSRHLWAEGTRLDSWMYRIMRNIWIDEARARQRRAKTFAPAEEGENAPDPGDRRLDAAVELSDVASATERLPNKQRRDIALVRVEGFGHRDTGS